MEEKIDLSQWKEKGGHGETVDKPGEGHRHNRQATTISRPHRLQIEEEGEKLSGDPGCLSGKHQQGNGGNAQTHQGQVIV